MTEKKDTITDAVLKDPVTQAAVSHVTGSDAPPSAFTQAGQAGSHGPDKPNVVTLASGQMVAAPTETEEELRTGAGQRETSNMWESTQRQIALSVVSVALLVAGGLSAFGKTESIQTAALVFLFGVANLVIGFYFGRTNHQRVGGVGPVTGR
jgi:hypothetical protein